MSNRDGFTLIELLIVVLVIGVLAAIAIPRLDASREQSYLSAMQTDLRNLVAAQETYLAETGTYATSAATLNGAGLFDHSPSVSFSTFVVTGDVPNTWYAIASHTDTNLRCSIDFEEDNLRDGIVYCPPPGGSIFLPN